MNDFYITAIILIMLSIAFCSIPKIITVFRGFETYEWDIICGLFAVCCLIAAFGCCIHADACGEKEQTQQETEFPAMTDEDELICTITVRIRDHSAFTNTYRCALLSKEDYKNYKNGQAKQISFHSGNEIYTANLTDIVSIKPMAQE